MKRTHILPVLLIAGLLLHTVPSTAQNDKSFEISKNLEIFAKIFKDVNAHYVDEIEPGKVVKTAIDAMLSSLDPYTNYYPESDMEDVKLQLLGEYGGIGALIHQKGEDVFISSPYEGLPADQAGLRAGDRIISVGGESAKGKTTAEVSSILRGQAGTPITLKLERNGETFERTLVRRAIKLENVPYYGLVGSDIGYIKLNEFTQDAAKNIRAALLSLKQTQPDLRGLILDLRGNGGGLLNEAVDIVNLFVRQGELIVETKGKIAARNTRHFTTTKPVDTELPLVVLINGYSASASEIVSGSLQDLDRAVIVGSRSFGKGLVQNILPENYNTQMKITVSKYYIPSGRCIQALDYAHRDENGRATKIPDSLKTAFKTRHGRTVYDGFGIEPDVEMKDQYMSSISMELVAKLHYFDYATRFRREHESIAKPSEFEITDNIYNDFKQYLSTQKLDYSTATEHALKELRKVAKEENYLDSIAPTLDALEQRFRDDKAGDLDKFRPEVASLLKSEILSRYYYERGRIEGSLRGDPDVEKAIEILHDPAQYKKLLSK
ncbi:MAG: S41 family peptidase [Bacteroidales bacterium]|nr:S41 family peptidase [Bacteroidales bacterium]